jgi:WD40 repeat protein/serine/threonine protein kinase
VDSSGERDPVEVLADDFVQRQRRGEKPTLAEYVARYPDLADYIRAVFPALLLLEDLGQDDLPSGDAPPRSPSATPVRLGEYRLLREIGRGGMGVVYEAEQETLGRRVALKVLPASAFNDEQKVRRFEREAKAAAKLHHTNIVPVFGVGQWREHPDSPPVCYYAMQLITGLGLDGVLDELKRLRAAHSGTKVRSEASASASPATTEWIRPGGEKSPPVAERSSSAAHLPVSSDLSSVTESDRRYWVSVARVGVQVADALAHAHGQGVLHRDIKPSNLLLDHKGNVWVTDFGLAKAASDGDDLTHTGDIVGTLRYMAPERFQGRADARSDLYALGLTLYELLTLRPAFDETDRGKLLHAILHSDPPRPRRLNPQVPVDLETIVLKAVARDPAARYASAAEMADDLRRFIDDRPIRARRASALERFRRWGRRNPGLAVALMTVLATLLLGTAVSTFFAVVAHGHAARSRDNESRAEAQAEEAHRKKGEAETARVQAELAGQVAEEAREDAETARRTAERNQYYAEMLLAAQAANLPGGVSRLNHLLPRWRPLPGGRDLRGWEWYYLRGLCHRPLRVLDGHDGEISAVGWSSDGQRLASAGADGTVRLWDPRTGQERAVLSGHEEPVITLAFSPDGTRLASADAAGVVRLWDGVTGADAGVIPHLDFRVRGLCWSPDGKRLAAACADHRIRIWVAETRRPARLPLRGHTGPVQSVSWSPDGKRLASGGMDQKVYVWDARSGECLNTLHGHQEQIFSVDWHPDGNRLASAAFDQTVRIWRVDGSEEPVVLHEHVNSVRAVRWSPDGKRLASASRDHTVRIWDAATQDEITVLRGHLDGVQAVCWSPDGKTLASGGMDGRLLLWDADSRDESNGVLPHGGEVMAVSWSPDGNRLASAGPGQVRVWDVRTRARTADLTGHRSAQAVAWSPDGSRLATAGSDGRVRLGDPDGRQEVVELIGHKGVATGVSWSPDGTRLASSGRDGTIRIWDVAAAKCLRITKPQGVWIRCVRWSPDGRRLASGGADGTVLLWDAETGVLLDTLSAGGKWVRAVAWSRDGTRLAVGNDRGLITLWDLSSKTAPMTLRGHTSEVRGLDWSQDGIRLASASQDGTVKVWDAATGQEALSLHGHTDYVEDVRWSPDGRRLASGCQDHTVRLWDAGPGYAAEGAAKP